MERVVRGFSDKRSRARHASRALRLRQTCGQGGGLSLRMVQLVWVVGRFGVGFWILGGITRVGFSLSQFPATSHRPPREHFLLELPGALQLPVTSPDPPFNSTLDPLIHGSNN